MPLMFKLKLFWKEILYSVKLLVKHEDKIKIIHSWTQSLPSIGHYKTAKKCQHHIRLSNW